MAYTASALSFMLEDLSKPVIVTGSQIPLAELRSDGQVNLLNALYVAANFPIAEVGLFFNNRLLRGNRSRKVDADGFSAANLDSYWRHVGVECSGDFAHARVWLSNNRYPLGWTSSKR